MANHSQALASHLISQTHSSILLLESLSLITPQDASLIRSRLPSPHGPLPSLSPSQNTATQLPPQAQAPQPQPTSPVKSSPNNFAPKDSWGTSWEPRQPPPLSPGVPPLPARAPTQTQEVRAKALWDYSGSEADDLTFRSGDSIIIDEEVNDQWFRGRVIPQGQSYPLPKSGLFPSTYVEKQQSSSSPLPPQQMIPYGQQQQQLQPQYYQPPPNQMMMQPPTQMMAMAPQQIEEEKKKGRFGKIGGQLGNAAVNGFGFGAGVSRLSPDYHYICPRANEIRTKGGGRGRPGSC
ncbi:LAS seventeen-binding protein 1/2, partial [Tremellales sp. Uapishka_1]